MPCEGRPQSCPHPAGTVRLAIISPAGNSDRPPSRRVARVLRDRDGLLLTRVRASSGARCPCWAAAVPAFSRSKRRASSSASTFSRQAGQGIARRRREALIGVASWRHKTTSVSSGRNQMHTDDLVAIRDALTAIIALPPPIREFVASLFDRWRHYHVPIVTWN
jgi:hypothetical protein